MVKGIFLLLARDKLIKSMGFLSRFYEQHQHNQRTWPIFDAFVMNLRIYLNAVVVLYALLYIGCICAPLVNSLIMYTVYDARIFLLPIVVPGTSLDEQFVPNLLYQFFICNMSVAIYMYFDAIFMLQLVHVILMANIVRQRIRVTERVLMAERELTSDLRTSLRSVIELQNELRE